ncbi:hypothetical protein GEMRC1_013250 [Eukaryota sp. GEM-RC1]
MSLRNVVKRRTHKERHQPERRAKLGILEKHKDYVKRAKDYNRKQETLRDLKKRARERNPDEFAFGMIKSKVVDGVHHTPRHTFTKEEVLEMKDVDLPYVLRRLAVEERALKSLQSKLIPRVKPTITRFIDSDDDSFAPTSSISSENPNNNTTSDSSDDEIIIPEGKSKETELMERAETVRKLKLMARELHLQRELMQDSKARKNTSGSMPVYKWATKRKK